MILLFGLPRSGTTWIGKILDSHPDTFYRHEPDNSSRLASLPLLPAGDPGREHVQVIHDFVAGIPLLRDSKTAGSTPVFRKSWQPAWRRQCYHAGIWVSRLLSRLGFGRRVLCAPRPGSMSGVRIVWKSIESLARIGWIMQVYPDAIPIQLVRHPCGHIASVLKGEEKQKFSSNASLADDLGIFELLSETAYARDRGLDIAQFRSMSPEERLAWRWVIMNEFGIDATELYGGRVFSYDRFCEDPLAGSAELLKTAGLSEDIQVTDFVERSTVKRARSSYYGVYRDPLKAANQWRHTLTGAQIERILSVTSGTRPGSYFPD